MGNLIKFIFESWKDGICETHSVVLEGQTMGGNAW